MSGFKVQKQNATALAVTDLGLTITGAASSIFDLTNIPPEDLARSTDLTGLVTNGDILVVDARDDADGTVLSVAESLEAIENHNDTHFGINGGRFGNLDDPTIALSDNFVVQYDLVSDKFESIDPASLVTQASVQESIEDIIGGMGINGTDTTFTYLDGAGTIEWSVNDVFLRNTGDTLDSGALIIADGATLQVSGDSGGGGATFAIALDATATIATPTGGFSGNTDIVNKLYIDQIAAGLDWKESVRAATTVADGDITAGAFGGVYAAGGGPNGTGEFTGVDLSSATGGSIDGIFFTGTASTGFIIGDRIVIKNQTDATQNGIYEITAAPTDDDVTLTRAADHDGVPADEVSGGNTVYIEDTTAINASSVNSNTIWSIVFDGTITLNTDDIVWTQVSGPVSTVAREGLSSDGLIIDLDVDDLTIATIVTGDSLAFHDANGTPNSSGSQTRKTTIQNFLDDLEIANAIGTGTGIIVKTADGPPDTYTTRTIVINGLGNLDGLAISDGDGVTGNPTIGLDIQNLPARSTAIDTTDRVAVWRADGTDANEYYTVGEIAGSATASNSFETWARDGNGTGLSIVADSPTDTVTITGGIGIDIVTAPSTDTVTWIFSNSGMADTPITTADAIPFFDATNVDEPEFRVVSSLITDLGLLTSGNQAIFTSVTGDTGTATADTNTDSVALIGATDGGITTIATDDPEQVTFSITPIDLATGVATLALGDFIVVSDSLDTATTIAQKYTFTDVVEDLDIPNAITVNGIIVRTAEDTYASRTIVASADEDELGITITDGDGVSGNPQIGLDIVGLTDPGADMAATDEFPVHDKSEGTAGANRKITGQNIADGVQSILGLASGLTTSTINGQPIVTYTDSTRTKTLSIESNSFQWSENRLNNNDWLSIGNASDTDNGWIMPLDGTIVMATGFTEDGKSATMDIDLYIDGVDNGSIGTLTGSGNAEFINTTLDLNFSQGDKLRLRGNRTSGGGVISDVNVVVLVRWRAA